jgi:hypothetical protein
MRTDIAAFLVSLTVTSFVSTGCSGSGSSGGSIGGGSSGGNTSSGGSSNAGGSNSGGGGTNSSSGASASGSGGSGSSGGGSSGSGSSGGASASSSGSGGSSSGTDAAAVSGPYPSGPYCAAAGSNGTLPVGCVVPNMSWIGYDNETANELSTMEPYATYTLDDARRSGKRYAMINVAEFECPGCQNSATLLGTVDDAGVTEGASVVHAGGILIEVLETAGFYAIATQTDLQSWVNKYGLMVTTVKDPDSSTGTPTLTQFGHRDQAYIVDLTTMKIIQVYTGSFSNSGSMNSAPEGMAAMHMLLGK